MRPATALKFYLHALLEHCWAGRSHLPSNVVLHRPQFHCRPVGRSWLASMQLIDCDMSDRRPRSRRSAASKWRPCPNREDVPRLAGLTHRTDVGSPPSIAVVAHLGYEGTDPFPGWVCRTSR